MKFGRLIAAALVLLRLPPQLSTGPITTHRWEEAAKAAASGPTQIVSVNTGVKSQKLEIKKKGGRRRRPN